MPSATIALVPEGSRPVEPTGACRRAVPLAIVAATITGGFFLLLMPFLLELIPATRLPAPFTEQNQTAESLIYLLSFGVALPAAIWVAFRLEARQPDRPAFEALAATLLGGLALTVILIWLATELGADRLASTFLLGLAWFLAVATLSRRPYGSRAPRLAWVAALTLVAGAIATVVGWSTISLPALLVSLALGLLVLALVTNGRPWPPLPRWLRVAVDVGVVGLLLLAVPDTMILYPEAALTDGVAAFDTEVIQFHQNLYLGAASQVLAGYPVLANTVSQYGAASIYLIAGFFKLVPISHGLLGLLDGMLTGLCFAAGYLTLRLAGIGRTIASLTMLVALIALAWGSHYPQGSLLQQGSIRFGLPMILIPLAVAIWRLPRFSTWFRVAALAVVGLSAIWALEAFIYVTFTWVAIVLVNLARVEPGRRLSVLIREAALTLASIAVFHLAFAVATLVAAGSLPDWGSYLTYLSEFLGGDIGDLTYDFDPFSPALGVAFAYLASAAGVVALVLRGGLRDRPGTLVALAGLTAYGVILFSYFDNRSLASILSYVSLPAVLLAGLWLGLLMDRSGGFGLFARRLAGTVAVAGSAVLISVAWPIAEERAPDSVLAVALPGGPGLKERLQRLRQMPPLVEGADTGQMLVDRYIPGDGPVAVVAVPDLDVNILVRAGRANALGITDAKEASWVPGPHVDEVSDRVAGLEPGQRMLLDAPALAAWRLVQAGRADDREIANTTGIGLIQILALRQIAERFRLETVARDPGGLRVVRLVPVS